MDGLIEISGTVEDIVFANRDNGYTVCVLDDDGTPVTCVGIMPYLSEGEYISVKGEWTTHPTFGKQLKVAYFEKQEPTGEADILRYLASGAVKGIGPVTAKRIVERFGDETLDVIEEHWNCLADIRGISMQRAEQIHDEYQKQFGVRRVMMHFTKYFGASLSVKIFKRYGSGAIELVGNDPYRLCREIDGIGFDKADKMAFEIGVSPDSPARIAAYIYHILNLASYSAGHCYLGRQEVVNIAARDLHVSQKAVLAVLHEMEDSSRLAVSGEQNERIYLPEMYKAETYVAQKLQILSNARPLLVLEGVDGAIDDLQNVFEIEYDEAQRDAIKTAVTHGVSIVTGGPGTGKTTVIKAIINIFTQLKHSFALAAPTGRAAKRMSEASGKEAKTIHRLLEWEYSDENGESSFRRNETAPLPYGAVIIDETSMVDVVLMEALLRAIKPGTFLIFIGDADQLPPVGAGNCLCDMINSGIFNVCRLQKIFRQAEKSLIVVNAHSINEGRMPRLDVKNSDFFFLPENSYDSAQKLISSLCAERLPRSYGLDPLLDIQVITPTRKGELGTKELNAVLQTVLNPTSRSKRECKRAGCIFREGDKVMQNRNDYDITWTRGGKQGEGIFNGDIGTIAEIDIKNSAAVIMFDDRRAIYDFNMLDEVEHAFAVTVHKSQGSEYRFVIIPAFECPKPLMSRALLYTAVTRAKEAVIIVGKRNALEYMVSNDIRPNRNTGLLELLCQNR